MSLIAKILPINNSDDIGSFSNDELNLHDCLTDNADWNDEYWDFYPNCLGDFTSIIKRAFEASTKGIEFQAIWAGDIPELTVEVTIGELLNTFSSNKVKNRAVYVVNKHI